MTGIVELFPPLGLVVQAGPLELRGITDELLAGLADLALRGIHDPDAMPFYVPWTQEPPETFARSFAQYHWRSRADFSPGSWVLNLAVLERGELVGVQGIDTDHFLTTRTGETGSWLGQEFQSRGIGTAMRRAICALAFDHLDFEEVSSGAFLDNPASLAVSRKVGYSVNGIVRKTRRQGEMALNQQLVLSPDTFVRGPHELQVSGLEAFREAIGLD